MNVVVVAEESREKPFLHKLEPLLRHGFSVARSGGGSLSVPCGGADLLLTDASSLEQLECHRVLLLYRDPVEITTRFSVCEKAVAVVDACKPELLALAGSTGMVAITCGLSPRDTLTLSSIEDDRAVLGLQRSVTDFNGAVLEPQEFPLHLSERTDNYMLMAAVAVYLMNGKKDLLCDITL